MPSATPAPPLAAVTPVAPSPFAAPAAPASAPFASASAPELLDEREHAIEVAAMLGDSVVAIKHCVLPAKERKLASHWWFVISAAALAVSLLSFALTLRVAARNDAGMDEWIKRGRPAYAFRPELVGAGHDAAGFAGLAVALAAATMGLIRRRQGRAHPLFRIGTAADVELPVADAPMASFPVVGVRGDRLVISAAPAFGGELLVDGTITSVSELAAQGRARALGNGACELQLPVRGRLRLRCGSATLLLSAVPRPARQLPMLGGQLDQRPFGYLAGALALHLVAAALLRVVPEEATVANSDLPTEEDIRLRAATIANDQKVAEPDPGAASGAAGGSPDASAAMALPAGAAGDPSKAPAHNRLSIKRTGETEQLARQQAVAEAVRTGILGSHALREANFQAIVGTADLSSGLDATTYYGNFDGDQAGSAYGVFGGAPTGTGPGGGGTDGIIGTGGRYRTIGTVPVGVLNISSRHCNDARYCGDGGGGRGEFRPPVKLGEPQCTGENGSCGLDKSIIRRYIKRSMEKIRYCYEKELLAKPSLAGTVMSSFVISPSGAVMSPKASGVDPLVASCVAGVVGAIAFPSPGEPVQVNYPFIFRNTQ